MEHISNIIKETTKLKVKPISTGFKFLDKAIGGYYPGSMTTICGAEDCRIDPNDIYAVLNAKKVHFELVY